MMRRLGLRLRFCLHVLAGTYVDVCVWLMSAGDSEVLRLPDRAVLSIIFSVYVRSESTGRLASDQRSVYQGRRKLHEIG
jgi:hypothetical protein